MMNAMAPFVLFTEVINLSFAELARGVIGSVTAILEASAFVLDSLGLMTGGMEANLQSVRDLDAAAGLYLEGSKNLIGGTLDAIESANNGIDKQQEKWRKTGEEAEKAGKKQVTAANDAKSATDEGTKSIEEQVTGYKGLIEAVGKMSTALDDIPLIDTGGGVEAFLNIKDTIGEIQTSLIEAAGGAEEWNEQMREIEIQEQGLKGLEEGMAAIGRELKELERGTEAYNEKSMQLANSTMIVDEYKNKISELKEELLDVNTVVDAGIMEKFNESIGEIEKGLTAAAGGAAALKAQTMELSESMQVIEVLKDKIVKLNDEMGKVSKFSPEWTELNSTLIETQLVLDKATVGASKLADKLEEATSTKSFAESDKILSSFKNNIVASSGSLSDLNNNLGLVAAKEAKLQILNDRMAAIKKSQEGLSATSKDWLDKQKLLEGFKLAHDKLSDSLTKIRDKYDELSKAKWIDTAGVDKLDESINKTIDTLIDAAGGTKEWNAELAKSADSAAEIDRVKEIVAAAERELDRAKTGTDAWKLAFMDLESIKSVLADLESGVEDVGTAIDNVSASAASMGSSYSFAIDNSTEGIKAHIAALTETIDALKAIESHGVSTMMLEEQRHELQMQLLQEEMDAWMKLKGLSMGDLTTVDLTSASLDTPSIGDRVPFESSLSSSTLGSSSSSLMDDPAINSTESLSATESSITVNNNFNYAVSATEVTEITAETMDQALRA
jgi:hypothetical protein